MRAEEGGYGLRATGYGPERERGAGEGHAAETAALGVTDRGPPPP
jgi:hypothetical protein